MRLRKTTIDNSVRYVTKDDHVHSEQTELISKERKKVLPVRNFHERRKKIIKKVTGQVSKKTKW